MNQKVVKLSSSRVTFTWITDLHFSAVPPGRRRDNYTESLFTKLEFVRSITEKYHGACLVGGDVFHHKHPKHPGNALSMIERLIRVFGSYPKGCVWGAVGNHDIQFDRQDTLPNQPLGILIAAGVYNNLVNNPVLFVNQDESVKVSVETFPYLADGRALEAILGAGPRMPRVTHRVGIVHAFGHPGDGSSLFGEPTIGYNQLKNVDFDILLWGHDHSRKETVQVGNVTHINLGSLARAAFSYDEVDRPVVAAIMSFRPDGNWAYKEQELGVKPLEVAFQTADKGMEKVGKSDELKEFFVGMDEQIDGLDTTDTRKVIEQLCAGEPKLLTLILELCEL